MTNEKTDATAWVTAWGRAHGFRVALFMLGTAGVVLALPYMWLGWIGSVIGASLTAILVRVVADRTSPYE